MTKPKTKPTMHIQIVTPEQAKEWLAAEFQQRPIKFSLVSRFAREMKAGRWLFTADPIRFDKDGNLIDGQHRLRACVSADTPFETVVWTGFPSEVFKALDRGRTRSLGDNLHYIGEGYYNQLGAAINLQWQYEHGIVARRGNLTWPEMTEAIDTLERNPGLRLGLAISTRLKKLASGGMLTFLHYQFSIRDSATAAWFFERLHDGCDLEITDPVRVLRERLLKNRAATVTKLTHRATMALIIKAWNATYARQKIRALSWRSGGKFPQPFPVIEPPMDVETIS